MTTPIVEIPSRGRLLCWLTAAVTAVLAAVVALLIVLPNPGRCIVRVELAGSGRTFYLVAGHCTGLTRDTIRTSLYWDFALIACYGAGLALICWIGAHYLAAGRSKVICQVAAGCAVAAAIFDTAENMLLWFAVASVPNVSPAPPYHYPPDGPFAWAEAMALVKFVAFIAATACALAVFGTLLGRLLAYPGRNRRPLSRSASSPVSELTAAELGGGQGPRSSFASRVRFIAVDDPGPPADVAEHAWARNYRVPAGQLSGKSAPIGVCLSGGGIRAGTFSMGAVQALAEKDVLARAQYLATVSGGGYFGSAYQMLRMMAADPPVPYAITPMTPAQAYAPGSPEEDLVRRHGNYIADGALQWSVAVFVLVRNLLLGLALIYAVIILVAWVAAGFYSLSPEWSLATFPEAKTVSVQQGAWFAVGAPLTASIVLWAVSGVRRQRWRLRFERAAILGAGLAAAVGLAAVAVPALAAWVASTVKQPAGGGATVPGIVALVAALTTLWNALSKGQSNGPAGASGTTSVWGKITSAAGFATRLLLTFLVLAALLFLAVILFAAELRDAVILLRQHTYGSPALYAAAGGLLLALLVFDQTRMSLHPFYKSRLASAFNVRRVGPGAEVVPYSMKTRLSRFGRPLSPEGQVAGEGEGLRLLLCAAAHVSGPALAPPGRRVVPFVFSSDYVGSPDLGYFATRALEEAVQHKAYESDVTLLAAAAISGAAIASSMGSASTPFDRLLAVSNARLGAWLPNPRYHELMQHRPGELPPLEVTRKALPSMRRLQYYARELAGVYPADDRFVYVTDGGHYENLGLVELLRRRCTTIYCVDASGDHSLAFTLAEAAALAHEELGVTISIEGLDLSTISATQGPERNVELLALHKRLSETSVVRGSYKFPKSGGRQQKGRLVVGKAVLGEDLLAKPEMFPLLTHASKNPDFPGDTTADQWFDIADFQSYLALGRLVGLRMAEELPPSPREARP